MRLEEKKEVVEKLAKKFQEEDTTFLVEYRGLNVAAMSLLRSELRKNNGSLRVVKNSLAKLASKGTAVEKMSDDFKGPIAVTFASEKPVEVAKTLLSFSKDNPKLIIKSGVLQGKEMSLRDVEALAKLPSQEVLFAQLLGTIQAPIQQLYTVLQENSRKVVRVINAKAESASE